MKHENFLYLVLVILVSSLWLACNEDEEVPEDPVYVSSLDGTFDAHTRMYNRDVLLIDFLGHCEDIWWEGTVVLTAEQDELDSIGVYKISTQNELNEIVEDPSMGGYYNCHPDSRTDPSLLPNSDDGSGTFRMNDNEGALYWSGTSQWGETHFMHSVSVVADSLFLSYDNDYGESFDVILIRTDGNNWDENLRDGDG